MVHGMAIAEDETCHKASVRLIRFEQFSEVAFTSSRRFGLGPVRASSGTKKAFAKLRLSS